MKCLTIRCPTCGKQLGWLGITQEDFKVEYCSQCKRDVQFESRWSATHQMYRIRLSMNVAEYGKSENDK